MDGVADYDAVLLVVVKPLLNRRLQVVFSGSRALQLGCSNFLNQSVSRLDRPVHADEEVSRVRAAARTSALRSGRARRRETAWLQLAPELVKHRFDADIL